MQGHFTILSISGAILQQQPEEGTTPNGSGGGATPGGSKRQRDMMSFISASLANPTGGVVGGTVAGALEANSVVTVSRLAAVDALCPSVLGRFSKICK